MTGARHDADGPEWGVLRDAAAGLARPAPSCGDGAALTVAARDGRRRRPPRRADPGAAVHRQGRHATTGSTSALVTRMAVIGAVVIVVCTFATRAAVVRLAQRSEHALYGLRTRAFAHIHAPVDRPPRRRAPRLARRPGHLRHRDHVASSSVGRHRLAARRHAHDRRRHHDARSIDWLLALVAFVMAAPLFLVLRQLQRRLVAAYDEVRERNADTLSSVSEVVMGAPVVRAYDAQATDHRPGHGRHPPAPARRGIRAGVLSALPVPVGRGVLGADHRRRRGGRRVAGPGVGPDRRATGRLPVPRVPVPRADRRVHRDPRPDPDRGGRLAARAGRARHADRDRGAGRRRRPAARTAPHRGRPRHLRLPAPARPGRRRRRCRRWPTSPSPSSRPTSVAVVGATGSGKTTLAKLLTRLADPTDGRGARRRASTCATCRWRRCARRW